MHNLHCAFDTHTHFLHKYITHTIWPCTDLEGEGLVEDGVERFAVDLGLVLLLLVGRQVDLDVGVRRSTHVHAGQVSSLDHCHRQLHTTNTGMKIVNTQRDNAPISITYSSHPLLTPTKSRLFHLRTTCQNSKKSVSIWKVASYDTVHADVYNFVMSFPLGQHWVKRVWTMCVIFHRDWVKLWWSAGRWTVMAMKKRKKAKTRVGFVQ